jgi:hypothetical protein
MSRVRGGVAVLLGVLALAPSAQAAQRYAAPAGSGAECSQPKPCSLTEAMGKAKTNDEVIVTGGGYTLSAPATVSIEAANVDVHGDLSGRPPTINATSGTYALALFGPKSRLSYVNVTNNFDASAAVACGAEVTVERVMATGVSKNGQGLLQYGACTVRDSVIGVVGSEAAALLTTCESVVTARNVTVVATGAKSVGVRVAYSGIKLGGNCTLDLKNAIVSGEASDLETYHGGIGPGNITVDHSNFDVVNQVANTTIIQGTGNQAAAPLFVDAANGDYREAAGSPTIDAGLADQLGSLDLAGGPRTVGSAPDIGAYEFVPTPVAPVLPGQIQSLTLAPSKFRTVNAGGAIVSSAKRKAKAPIGTTVTYALSAKAATEFFVERKVVGRKANGKCRKATKANRGKKKCATFSLIKTGFAHSGQAGLNTFKFSGRLGSAGLKPGGYRLRASAGGASRTVNFKIVK